MERKDAANHGTDTGDAAFPLTLPEREADLVRESYSKAKCVLEYGSGGSTHLAMQLKVPHVFSVESDLKWAQELDKALKAEFPSQHCVVHHVDIGKTVKWGRPANNSGFTRYHRYPTDVWDREDFVYPDVVLIDGRFRVACFLTVMLRAKNPVTVLFDDYIDREEYHWIEDHVSPVDLVGRMARFEILPRPFPVDDLTRIAGSFADER